MKTKQILVLIVCWVLSVNCNAQTTYVHPWQGKRVAYFGDSITDPNNKAAKRKYWHCLQEWLRC